jgi:cobalamin transport system substrate-binding protein
VQQNLRIVRLSQETCPKPYPEPILRARGNAGANAKAPAEPRAVRQELLALYQGLQHESKTRTGSQAWLTGTNLLMVSGFAVILACCLTWSCSSRQSPPGELRVIVDELGRKVELKSMPARIVSLAPSVTETLFALGLADQIVGVTTYCDYPPDAQQKQKVGDTLRPSIERIVALKPDLVIASTSSQLEQFVAKLEELGIPLYISNPRDIPGVISSIERIGELTGVADRARALSTDLRRRIDAVERSVSGRERPSVLLVLGSEPLITAGRASFIDDIITRAGGQSISADQPTDYPQFSLETAVARKPELIFLQSGEGEIPSRLKLTPAGRQNRIFHVDDELLLRPGPRVVEGLEEMARRIHPGAFTKDRSENMSGRGLARGTSSSESPYTGVTGSTASLRRG